MTESLPPLSFATGPKSLLTAVGILWRRPSILLWLIPPLLITLLLDGLVFYFSFTWLHAQLGEWFAGGGWRGWLRPALDVVGGLAVVVLLGWSFAWLFLTLTSPFQDFISAAVEREMRGVAGPEPAGFSGFLRGMTESVVQAVVFTVVTIFVLLLGLIPLLGPVLVFLWTAFALGYSFAAIPSGRMAHRFAERVAFARRNLRAIVGLGGFVVLASLIPVGNVLLMPLFVVGGTVLYLRGTHSSEWLAGGEPVHTLPVVEAAKADTGEVTH